MSLNRIESFSDGVFAVAITLLILDVKLPVVPMGKSSNSALAHALVEQWPHYMAYVISFMVIGAFWMGHHRFFHRLARHDEAFTWINILYLMAIVFIPYPTSVLSEYGGTRVATVFYAVTLTVCGLLALLEGVYASWQQRLLKDDVAMSDVIDGIVHNICTTAVFGISVGIAYLSVTWAKYFWLALIPLNLVAPRIAASVYHGGDEAG